MIKRSPILYLSLLICGLLRGVDNKKEQYFDTAEHFLLLSDNYKEPVTTQFINEFDMLKAASKHGTLNPIDIRALNSNSFVIQTLKKLVNLNTEQWINFLKTESQERGIESVLNLYFIADYLLLTEQKLQIIWDFLMEKLLEDIHHENIHSYKKFMEKLSIDEASLLEKLCKYSLKEYAVEGNQSDLEKFYDSINSKLEQNNEALTYEQALFIVQFTYLKTTKNCEDFALEHNDIYSSLPLSIDSLLLQRPFIDNRQTILMSSSKILFENRALMKWAKQIDAHQKAELREEKRRRIQQLLDNPQTNVLKKMYYRGKTALEDLYQSLSH